jgi:hypothetical protein
MRIPSVSVAQGTFPAATPGERSAQRTAVQPAEIRSALGRAYRSLHGRDPSVPLLDAMTAQACLETASGTSMYNYNFGGIKGAAPGGGTVHLLTRECLPNGAAVQIRDGFRAYGSLDDGARDYVRLLEGRFGGAVAAAESGTLRDFAHELKRAGYFTAPVEEYARALEAHVGVGRPVPVQSAGPGYGSTVGASEPCEFLGEGQLLNVFASLSMAPTSRTHEEEEDP